MSEPRIPDVSDDQLAYREIVHGSGLFDAEWYAKNHMGRPASYRGNIPALDHYVWSGAALGYSPGPAFDCDYYLSRHLDVTESGADPVAHYALHGRFEGRAVASVEFFARYRLVAGSGFFSWSWFSARYLGATDPGFDALEHYLQTGADTLHHPSPLFDSKFYASHPDIKENHLNPLAHYVQFGRSEGRAIRPVID